MRVSSSRSHHSHTPADALAIAALLVTVLVTGCTREVSFNIDVLPVLRYSCGECHEKGGEGYEKSGLDFSSYDTILKGTSLGPVIIVGSSASSTLARVIEHKTHPEIHMPRDANPLTKKEIETIKRWIDEGAKNN